MPVPLRLPFFSWSDIQVQPGRKQPPSRFEEALSRIAQHGYDTLFEAKRTYQLRHHDIDSLG